jgi:hypothetical protein
MLPAVAAQCRRTELNGDVAPRASPRCSRARAACTCDVPAMRTREFDAGLPRQTAVGYVGDGSVGHARRSKSPCRTQIWHTCFSWPQPSTIGSAECRARGSSLASAGR